MIRVLKHLVAVTSLILVFSASLLACPQCRAQVNAGIYQDDFFSRAAVLFVPLILIAGVGIVLFYGDKLKVKFFQPKINGKK